MKKIIFSVLLYCISVTLCDAQINIRFTNPLATEIVAGDYNTEDYLPTTVIDQPVAVIDQMMQETKAANLKDYLIEMQAFNSRNTGSDTLVTGSGIGAARDWAYKKFESFNEANEDRLIVSYLEFDQNVCGLDKHKNIVAVLPGVGPQHEELILIEAHFDSRCRNECDTDCTAMGMEDNASGSALVLEMARVMSTMTFNRTIVFMLTVGEEQGLVGAEALATYCVANELPVHAVFNNDIVGGVLCGETASPPGCPSLNNIDSINVRLYSAGTLNSPSKSLARFTKLEYQENLRDRMPVKPIINIMSAEDRIGRGGDHIPFRRNGYSAIRFTSANEHGDAGIHADYTDRQHTQDDILGVDTDGDAVIDSFFVDFNYLQRNALLNGNAAAMAAMGPITPSLESLDPVTLGLTVTIDDPNDYNHYRIGLRRTTNDFDTVYTTTEKVTTLTGLDMNTQWHFVSVAAVDENGVESLFSNERGSFPASSTDDFISENKLELLQNQPNPFDDRTSIGVWVEGSLDYSEARIEVIKPFGTILYTAPIRLNEGLNEIWYEHSKHHFAQGILYYRLVVDGKTMGTKSMVYAY